MMSSYRSRIKQHIYPDKNGKSEVVIHVLSAEPMSASEDLAIAKAFQPIYASMTVFGLLWKSHRSSGAKRMADCHTFHCCFMLMLLWYNALHFGIVYDGNEIFGEDLIIKLTGHINAIQIAFCLTAFIYLNHKHVPFFLRQWENYKLKHGGLTLTLMKKHLWRRLILANVIFALFFSTIIIVFAINPLMLSKYKYSFVPMAKYVSKQTEGVFGFIWVILIFYIIFALNQTVIVVTGFCRLISKEFQKLSEEFANTVSINSKTSFARMQRSSSQGTLDVATKNKLITYEVEQFRLRHLDLALLVGRLDDMAHAYLLFLYLFTLPIIVLLLFGAGDATHLLETDFAAYYIGVSGLIYFSVIIIWISRAGTSLATNILLHKLANDHTGLTLGKVINIDKGLFITLFTAIVTYLIWMFKLSVAFRGKAEKELSVINATSAAPIFN